ncbi:pentatricopeptide repeat-containing protein [Prunus yedoensis var. nudiflora]|uniref:Pentatricopeptide repeat-containing protein n=1 Tax=Prunus yedoensis var. nudiflora TaxID=2094558 RepID=A0A314XJS0_PRUYE|nr:pentatricopeptide repeat-containing protein [Prunus yedoensis var. nudiflora]
MCNRNVLPDDYTLATMAKVSGEVQDLVAGKSVHGKSIRVGSSRVDLGRRVFDRMKCRNVYAWTAMVNGYAHSGAPDQALVLFQKMQIHGFAIRKEMNHNVSLCNALIDMYLKCGSLDIARQVFEDDSFLKDAISWSSMISGYGLHGRGDEAIVLYNKMLHLGIKPDAITMVGILSACGRSGLVNEGLSIHSSLSTDIRIKPTVEICACVVDLLGRSGDLD